MAVRRTALDTVVTKFDRTLIQEILECPGGALYALTVPNKNGQNIMTHSTMTWDWHVLYDCRYNDTETQWEKTVSLWKRMREKEGLSTRRPKLTQNVWDRLDAQWKKELAAQKRKSKAAEKKLLEIAKQREEERQREHEEYLKRKEKERKAREREIKKLEAEEEAKKKKKPTRRKTTAKSKAKPKGKPKVTTRKPSTGKKTKWRDMKAKMEQDTLDAFM